VQQDIVAGEAEDIVDVVGLAPVHQVRAGEAGIAAHQDLDRRPGLPDASDDAFDGRLRALGAVDIAVTQLGQQEMRAAIDIQRQEAAVFVVAVEKAANLMAVSFHVRGVEVQGDPLGRGAVALGEQVDVQAPWSRFGCAVIL